jgi:hypothetical protein
MLLPNGEYRIPQGEFEPSPPETFEAGSVDDATQNLAQYYDDYSLVRGSADYENRAKFLSEQAGNLTERQALIDRDRNIHALRQAVMENLASTPKTGAMRLVLNMIMSGPIDSSVDRARQASEIFRDLMNKEGMIGASLCKKPDAASDHLFFLSDHKDRPHEWFYYAQSLLQPDISRTLRYVVSEQDGILKSIDGGPYEVIVGNELAEFIYQTKRYSDVVSEDYELAA